MKFTRILTAAAAACALLAGAVPGMQAKAAQPFTAVEYSADTVAVKCNDTSVVHAEIPAELDGKPVAALAEGCFDGCSALESVAIPETVTSIGEYAFQGCVLLETVEISAAVETIGDFAFEGCLSLSEIAVAEENTHFCSVEGVLYTADRSDLLRYPAAKEDTAYVVDAACKSIAPWCFTDSRNLKKVEMKAVNAVGADCFMGCTALRTVKLSPDIPELIGATFAKCGELKEVTLPTKLTSIGDRCFYGCSSLEKLQMPETMETIGEMAFFGCTQLSFLYVPGKVRSIGQYGVGYGVSESGEAQVIPGFRMETTMGSAAARYAKENGIECHKMISKSLAAVVGVGAVLAVLFVIGISVSVRRSKQQEREEAERRAEEEKQKKLAERRAARKKKE